MIATTISEEANDDDHVTSDQVTTEPRRSSRVRSAPECVGERSNFKKNPTHMQVMVMHSNERGECSPRTLIDRKRKRYDNAVDVVVRLHDRPILLPNVRHLCDLQIGRAHV